MVAWFRGMEDLAVTMNLDFYRDRRVLITGHTGFKGSWLCQVLLRAGAEVFGYSLPRGDEPELFELLRLDEHVRSHFGDVRDGDRLAAVLAAGRPEVVLHLAAQPLVLESYRDPVSTFEVNVMGTVNLLEAVRRCDSVESVVNVTTDKVYQNHEWEWPYREGDRLNGHDPYSNSKSCSELVTSSYVNSFLRELDIGVSTARAGNVIGGGDFAANRIIPDCVRSALAHEVIRVRNPASVRPYQHVLEPLSAYLEIARAQVADRGLAGAYNIGPDDADNVTTARLVSAFCRAWGDGLEWNSDVWSGPHESGQLRLDSSRITARLGWRPRWTMDTAVARVVEWAKRNAAGEDPRATTDHQIDDYFESIAAGGA